MDNVKDALLRMYRSAKKTIKLAKGLDELGLDGQGLYDISYEIADAIYYLIGEHTKTFDESITNLVLTTSSLTEERAATLLMNEYNRNILLPRPCTFEKTDFKKMYEQFGGYSHETPEGEWK